jgi:predicted transcriptional regulator
MAKRKRAPGGGRKVGGSFPGGERWNQRKMASLTVRLLPETRRALDELAATKGRGKVSATAEFVLRNALKAPAKASGHNQSLAAAVAALAAYIEQETGYDWRQDRFSEKALQAAILVFMMRIEAPDDGSTPKVPASIEARAAKCSREFADVIRSPDGLGDLTADLLFAEIKQAGSSDIISEWSLPIYFHPRPAQLALISRDLMGGAKKRAKAK